MLMMIRNVSSSVGTLPPALIFLRSSPLLPRKERFVFPDFVYHPSFSEGGPFEELCILALYLVFYYKAYVDSFARGVGLVSLPGDKSDGDREIDDLKLLYRAYVTNALASGHMQDNKYGFTKREKKKGFLKSLKILYVKKMSQRQKGMQNSLGKPPHW
ncbi:hypothetical protein P8452_41936 [Trifolium repens]|nr:hypothetical protein P8452_41936 [Trifolium repens]